MIVFENVQLKKDERLILSSLSLQMTQRRIAVIGHNGSGKSSFLRLINGLETGYEGHLTVDDISVAQDQQAVLEKVGFVFQNPDSQIIYPIVREDLAFGLQNRGFSKNEIQEKIQVIASKFGIAHLLDRLAHTLSGGEKQLVALMSVVIMEPEYILLDEPTTLLDLKNKNKIMMILRDLPQKIIMISHDLEFLQDFDFAVRFEEGKIIDQGQPEAVISKYRSDSLC